MTPAAWLEQVPVGTRIVVRYLLPDGRASDALGVLTAREHAHVVVETKRGPETVPIGAVIAAKQVPPAPTPRPRSVP